MIVLNEGLFKNDLDKIEKWINEYEKTKNAGWLRKVGSKIYKIKDKNDPRYKTLLSKYEKLQYEYDENIVKDKIKDVYEYWSNPNVPNISITWEGKVTEILYLIGISNQNMINHFSKITKQTFKDVMEYATGGNAEDLDSYKDSIIKLKLNYSDKVIVLYTNDDNALFYDYKINKLCDIQYNDQIYISSLSNLYKEYIYYDIEDYDDEEKALYKSAAAKYYKFNV